ncbi:YkyB family protein [Bacillus carboniphilus]|uniref:YkyB family protein n=1 Tax=Bacillus carboniphilus TaxID=86663 RepID=A0ABY9JZW8_9BACI|nr:YkyB family protein [Bacillus carboniphilus]WLR43186.1 YkyB family protein [Bacillus carboniphilus]
MDDHYQDKRTNHSTDHIAEAIFTVNRHAKTAPDPKFLYLLKRKALIKLLKEGKASKKGLHYSNNPRFSQQSSDVLIEAGKYYFHMPPTKEDFKNLPHLGKLSSSYRNPKSSLSLSIAKEILQNYVGLKDDHEKASSKKQKYEKPVFKKLGETY